MSDIKKLEALLSQGRISRRDFLTRSAAFGAAAAVGPSLLIGEAQAAPKRGGHFKAGIGSGSTTDSLDPATYADTYNQQLGFAHHNYLTEVDHTGAATPELAESIEPSADAKTWVVKLRKGVEFHNGKSLTSEDVVASFNHHRGEDTKSAAKGVLEAVNDIRADGPDTVVFSLAEGNADFPFIMSDYHIAIMPSAGGKVNAASGIGTGAYVIKEYEPGVVTRMERNPNYWKSGRAHFDSVELLAIKDVAARTNALTTGEIHLMDRCDLKTVHLLKRNKSVSIEQHTGTQHYSIPMITTSAPYDDNNVRLALKHAVDREALVKTILRGYGQTANDHPISPANKFYNKDLPQRAYDPDKAKFYMKKAGVSSLSLDLSAAESAFGGAVDAAVLYKEHAAKAGININVIREANDGYWSNVWMKKAWCMCYWAGRPTEDWMFSIAYARGANWNDSFWDHDRFNELLVQARGELDESKRRTMYYEMQQIVRDDGGVVIPMYASYVFARSNKVTHAPNVAANWDLDGNRAAERWWFA